MKKALFYKIKSKKKTINRAFTLIELTVVLLVVSILLYGTLSTSGMVNSVKVNLTKDKLDVIYNALGSYLVANKRLPCPASVTLSKLDSNYGKEVRNVATYACSGSGIYNSTSVGSTNLVFGAIPTYALNLSPDFAEDSFGNKFSYFIDQRFTYNYISNIQSDISFSNASFGTAPYKDIMTIKNKNSNIDLEITKDAILVIVSHGVNGFGAFKTSGVQNQLATESEELENNASNFVGSNASFDKNFYYNSETGNLFDDIVLFKARDDFVENVQMMSIIPCKGNDLNDTSFTKVSVYYGSVIEATSSCQVGAESIKKTKKCDAYGRWVDLIGNCPNQSYLSCSVGGTGGMSLKTVNSNSAGNDGECEYNYAGYYSWSCSSGGVGTTTNNCVAYCNFSQVSGMAQSYQAPSTSGTASCSAGFTGFYEWSCSATGVGTVISNNCL